MEENVKAIYFGAVLINALKEGTRDSTVVVGSNNEPLDL